MPRSTIPIESFAPLAGLFLILVGCGGGGGGAEESPPAEAQRTPPKRVESKAPAAGERTGGEERAMIAEKLGIDLADVVHHESGLEWVVRKEGTGDVPKKGETIRAHYTGYLLDGKKFDSSVDRGQPFQTPIGVGRVIQGWDIAFTDMKVGEKRVLFIPPELGYGARGAGGVIPPNAQLVFDVELLGISK